MADTHADEYSNEQCQAQGTSYDGNIPQPSRIQLVIMARGVLLRRFFHRHTCFI